MTLPLLSETTTPALPWPAPEARAALLDLPPSRAGHAMALERHRDLFDRLEVAPSPLPPPADPVRIAYWNAERGKYLEPSVRLLGGLQAGALLLCELDLGMARSGQVHVTRELATRLGMGYAFGVEFLELGLGDARERAWHAGETNRAGLHGAAILSPFSLERPALIRLECAGDWFDGAHGERRVGGRIAIAATLRVGDRPVTLCSVHLESHSDPAARAAQIARLIDALEQYAPGRPTVIGGDLNTVTIGRDWARGTGVKPKLPPERLRDPVPWEPLFEVAAAAGYDWRQCNRLGVPTQRTRPDGTPEPPLGKIDWFLCRGLEVRDPQTIAAVDAAGVAISDHDVLAVSVRPTTAGPAGPAPSTRTPARPR